MTIIRNHKTVAIFLGLLLLIGMVSAVELIVTPTTSNMDAKLARNIANDTWTDLRNGAGTDITNTSSGSQTMVGTSAGTATNTYAALVRFGWVGNTSDIPDGATINSATFSVYGTPGTKGLGFISVGLMGFNPTNPTVLSASDYNTYEHVMYSDTNITYQNWSNTSWNTFTLNAAGLANISKTGNTKLMLRMKDDIDNTTTEISYVYDNSAVIKGYDTSNGAATAPKLTVQYTNPATVLELNPDLDGFTQELTTYPYTDYFGIRNGTGYWASSTGTYALVRLIAGNVSHRYSRNEHAEFLFDTSTIPDDAVISAATLSVRAASASYQHNNLGTPKYGVTGFHPTSTTNSSISEYDYNNFWDTRYATDISATASARNNWSFNALGLSNISKNGFTNLMVRSDWDIDNTNTTNMTWVDSANSTFYFFTNEAGSTNMPVLSITYTSDSGGDTPDSSSDVTFTSNITSNMRPMRPVQFTDTSTVSGITARTWSFYDYGTLPHRFGEPTLNNFSTDTSPTYTWGSGNFSIGLDVTNASGHYYSTPNTSWVNISAGSSIGYNNATVPGLAADYQFYPDDAIWNVPVNNLTVHSKSSDWISALVENNTERGVDTHLVEAVSYGVPYYTVNDSTVYKQKFMNDVTDTIWERGVYFPLPDDMVTWQEYDSDPSIDHEAFMIDTDHSIIYRIRSTRRQANGTWYGMGVVWNYSAYGYRFTPGATWLGNSYTTTAYGVTPPTLRANSTSSTGGGASDIPKIPGYARYEEVAAGYINHSLYIPIYRMNGTAIWPAMGNDNSASSIAYSDISHTNIMPDKGAWVRLKSSVDISGFQPQSKVIAQALKTYGGYVTENGGSFNVIGSDNPAWNTADLRSHTTGLYSLDITDFEFVDTSPLMIERFSMRANVTISPTASFYATPVSGASPLSVSFVDTSSGPATSWAWYWHANETVSSTSQYPTATLTTGNYSVRLKTTNAYGSDWENKTDYIHVTTTVCAPVANFTADVTTGNAPLTVTFTDTSTCYPTAWYWVFNAGGSPEITGGGNPTSHTYTVPGLYTVYMVAYNTEGFSSTYRTNYINVTSPAVYLPVANFTSNVTSGVIPFTVQFNDTSTGTPDSWYWVFWCAFCGAPDQTSVEQNPQITFSTAGTYNVDLTASNYLGDGSEGKSAYITALAGPTPTPTPTPVPTTVAPTPVITPSGTGPQINGYSSLTSNGVNISVTTSSIYGDVVWLIYGQNRGGYTWITQNVTKASTASTTIVLQGSPLFGNTAYWARACDASGCGNEVPFSTAAITPMPTTTFGYGFRQIVGMR